VIAVGELRSADPLRIKQAIASTIAPELAPHLIPLVGRDDVARDAITALHAIAPRCTGVLVDALLDPQRELAVRRRLPAVVAAGEPALATWGLWRGLGDPSFDVRYRCGAMLSRLARDGHLDHVTLDDVFAAVKREVETGPDLWHQRALDDDRVGADDEPRDGGAAYDVGLEHVFTVLGLALPAEPLRIALHALKTDDASLRGTALEYLESVLPADVRAQLWPLLDGGGGDAAAPALSPLTPSVPRRTTAELVDALGRAYKHA
jgi:ATP:ADP antiporter, AAA family